MPCKNTHCLSKTVKSANFVPKTCPSVLIFILQKDYIFKAWLAGTPFESLKLGDVFGHDRNAN